MEIPSDFNELLALLNAHKVEYVIIGAHALAHYGAPRLTGDLDILIRPDLENGKRIIAALNEFGVGSLDFVASDFAKPDNVVQIGVIPLRVDLLTSITGVTWDEAWSGHVIGKLGNQSVSFLSKEQFIANKRASGRAKDLGDLDTIGEL